MNNLGIAGAPYIKRDRLAQVSMFNIILVLSSIQLNSAKHRCREWELKFLKHSKIIKKYQKNYYNAKT